MKIVRLTTFLDFGGQERKYISFTEVTSNSKEKEYIFAALGHGGDAERIIRDRGFEVKLFNLNPHVSNLKNIIVLYRWLKSVKPDVVHTAAAEANFHGIIAAKLAGVKYVIGEEIGLPSHSKTAKKVFRLIYKLADAVVCVSGSVKNFLINSKEIDPQKGVIIYNPVSQPKVFVKEPSDKIRIVSVGRLEKIKNMQLLISAVAKVKSTKRDIELSIVGDGKERENLENQIKALNLTDKVKILGFKDTPEEYVSQSDLFILSSLSEGFGIAVVEAMLQKVPCLCSNVGGIPEFIKDGETGWLFNPLDEAELVKKLQSILDKPSADIERIGLNGYESVSGIFTCESYKQQIEQLYEQKKYCI